MQASHDNLNNVNFNLNEREIMDDMSHFEDMAVYDEYEDMEEIFDDIQSLEELDISKELVIGPEANKEVNEHFQTSDLYLYSSDDNAICGYR